MWGGSWGAGNPSSCLKVQCAISPLSGDSASSTFEHAAMSAGGGRGTAASLLTISNSIKEFGKTAEAWQVWRVAKVWMMAACGGCYECG